MSKDIKKRSRKQEKRIAKKKGGRRIIGSGAFLEKGDIETREILGECKFTDKDFFRITIKILQKIEKEAMVIGKKPRLFITFEKMPLFYTKDWEVRPVKKVTKKPNIVSNASYKITMQELQMSEDKYKNPKLFLCFLQMPSFYVETWEIRPVR